MLGRNGAGKSTLLRLLLGELHPAQHRDPASGAIRAGRRALRAAARPLLLVSAEQQDAYIRRGAEITGLEAACTGPLGVFLPYRDFSDAELAMGRRPWRPPRTGTWPPAGGRHVPGRAAPGAGWPGPGRPARVLLLDDCPDGLDRFRGRGCVRPAAAACGRATLVVSDTRRGPAHCVTDPCSSSTAASRPGRPGGLLPQPRIVPRRPRSPASRRPDPAFLGRVGAATVIRAEAGARGLD